MIYCVEDDAGIRELMTYTLRSTGYQVSGFSDGTSLLRAIDEVIPDLILLDIMLPGDDGISILKTLKQSKRTADIPVILATAKGTEYDKVIGLDLGADDYLVKPFGMMEMVSRTKAVLRRTAGKNSGQTLINGQIHLNPEEHTVYVSGQRIALTLKEFEVLHILMRNLEIVLTRDQLLNAIWGYEFDGETRTVDVHVRTLRQKLGECSAYIETIRGVGYKMEKQV